MSDQKLQYYIAVLNADDSWVLNSFTLKSSISEKKAIVAASRKLFYTFEKNPGVVIAVLLFEFGDKVKKYRPIALAYDVLELENNNTLMKTVKNGIMIEPMVSKKVCKNLEKPALDKILTYLMERLHEGIELKNHEYLCSAAIKEG